MKPLHNRVSGYGIDRRGGDSLRTVAAKGFVPRPKVKSDSEELDAIFGRTVVRGDRISATRLG